ncbi:MAG TPA: thioredoxin family protein [Actinomycetota bacterium]|nr:thioredoxin family protein [Actinomycetota bacterium]
MEAKLIVAALVAAAVLVGLWAWRRPPRRLSRMDLRALGIAGPAIVQFSTRSCAPCKAAVPRLRSTAERTNVAFHQVDVGARPEVARALGIRTVPTIAVAGGDGTVLGVWTGLPGNGEIAAAALHARDAG